MVDVALSIGSNISPEINICMAIKSLRSKFSEVLTSSVYESKAVGFEGSNFYNLVALIRVKHKLDELIPILKALEDKQGRDRTSGKFSGRTLDIDILTYGDRVGDYCGITLPRNEITENAFVLLPLSEILPDSIHPLVNKSYAEMWSEYDKDSQILWKIDFDCDAN